MFSRRWLLCAGILPLLAIAGLGAAFQPVPVVKVPPLPASLPVYSLWVPAANYTAIVVTSNAVQRRWIVSIKTRSGSFPVTIGPAQTIVIPFEKGWAVADAMEARVESQLISFEDLTQRNLLDGTDLLGVAAWGITDHGPVSFVPPKPTK
jgi:hypothetical protein